MLRLCACLGAVTLVFLGLTENIVRGEEISTLREAISTITADELKRHVDVLADDTFEGREAGSRGGRAAAMYLLKHFESHGLKGAGEDGGFFQSFNGSCQNILGLLEGSDPKLKNEIIVIGAHYDHVGYGSARNSRGPTGYIHNGADDNASGTAGILETIEAFAKLPQRPRRSILFAFWDSEEKGLLGSKHWIAQPTIPLEKIVLAVNIDMIGRLRNQQLKVFGTRTSRGLRSLVSYRNHGSDLKLNFTWEIKANSDHHPFFANKIPILMLHTGLHDDYHRPSDDAHKVNHQGMQQISQLLFRVAYELADREESNGFRDASQRETPKSQLEFEQPLGRPSSRFGVRWERRGEQNEDFYLTYVAFDSAADRAGLRRGDRLLRFAGRKVNDQQQLITDVLMAPKSVRVVVQRDGEESPREITVHLAGQPIRVGIAWREDEADPGTVMLTRIVSGSPAYLAGLKTRDRIYRLNNRTFSDGNELLEMLATANGKTDVLVERRGQLQTVQLELPESGDSTKSFSKSYESSNTSIKSPKSRPAAASTQ